MLKKFKFLTIATTVIVLILGTVIGASGVINIISSDSGRSPETTLAPLLIAPESAYSEMPVHQTITAPDDRIFAQFNEIPTGFGESISVSFPQQNSSEVPVDEFSFKIISSIRYTGEKGWVIITVAQPSSYAATQGFVLGNKEITLPNGEKAWATNDQNTRDLNQVAFVQDDLIISVAGSLSVSEIQGLTTGIVKNK